MQEVLDIEGLTIAFAGDPVVDGVSIRVARGRVLALVGESGSGKSLTAMSVLGLLPDGAEVTGSIRFAGQQLLGAPSADLRRVRGGGIGTVFQEPAGAFDPVRTVGSRLVEALRAHGGDAGREHVLQLLATAGLDDPARIADAYPHELSGGQLQRAMIATAVANDPLLLIADEPTTALDVTVQAQILDVLRRMRQQRETAVLLITHDMGVVADLADDVVVLRHGRVVERGDVRRVLTDPQDPYTRELLAAVPTAARPAAPEDEAPDAPVVRLRDAVVVHRRRGTPLRALDGVDLEIRRGEVVGLVGESGSGKSTIGRVLAGLVPLTSGTAEVAGTELTRASRRDLRRVASRIGIVFQDPASSLNPRDTVGTSVAEPLRLHTDLGRRARTDRVAELLDAVRLPADAAGRYPHELSGGQRQRVAIARALALGPDLLIADEPTSALDVAVQAAVLDLLEQLQQRYGFACLFISHDLAVVRRLAHAVVVLRRGRVVEQGPAQQVLANPQHDYTRLLLASAPVADPDAQAERRRALRMLEGSR